MIRIDRRTLLRAAISATAAPVLGALPAAATGLRGSMGEDANRDDATAGFDELPVGAVRPAGWLLGELRRQAAGVTSRLHTLYPPFTGDAWTTGESDPDGSWWPWEVRGYWCDGTLRCGLLLDDQALVDAASALVEHTFSHPDADGYLGPSMLKPAGDVSRWPHAVFFRAAMAWHDATGDARIVEGLRRHYVDSPFEYRLDRDAANIEAMLWTHARTGDARLLDLALATWRNLQAHVAKSKWDVDFTEAGMVSPGPVGGVHGVSFAEVTKLPALLYRATGDARFLRMAEGAHRKLFEHHMLVDGVPSTSEVLSTNTARNAHETCNVADYPWTWGYLLMASGDGAYGDRIEHATFNALPGSVRKDWGALQYFSSPNQFLCTAHSSHLCVVDGQAPSAIRTFRQLQRMSYRPSPGHTVVCCPANLARALPNYVVRMWMSDRAGKGLAAVLHGPSRVTARLGTDGIAVEIESSTRYPHGEDIVFHVRPVRAVAFPLHLRIPDWCAAPAVSINGEALALPARRRGFVRIDRTWRAGDVVRLSLPMEIVSRRWPEEGRSIERGPLVYAHAIPQHWERVADERASREFPAWDLTPTGRWNYALLPDTDVRKPAFAARDDAGDDPWRTPPSTITVAVRDVADWPLETSDVAGEPVRFTPRLPDPATLPARVQGAPHPLALVPYGCTELRIAVFPQVKTEGA